MESVLGRYSKSESEASLRRGAASGRCTAGLGDRSCKCHVSGTRRSSIRLFIAGNVSGSGQKRRVLDADISVIVKFAKLYTYLVIMDGLHFQHGLPDPCPWSGFSGKQPVLSAQGRLLRRAARFPAEADILHFTALYICDKR